MSEAADPLHFGTWGGSLSRILCFIGGFLLTGLVLSGAILHGLRLRAAVRRAGQGLFMPAWLAMRGLRWPLAALVVAAFALLPSWLE